jgi:hypothetical protein
MEGKTDQTETLHKRQHRNDSIKEEIDSRADMEDGMDSKT